jgi:hypothetical protein
MRNERALRDEYDRRKVQVPNSGASQDLMIGSIDACMIWRLDKPSSSSEAAWKSCIIDLQLLSK